MRLLVLGIALLSGCGADRTAKSCASGEQSCDGLVFVVCDDHGVIESSEDCGAAGKMCVPDRGCSLCVPGSRACRDEVIVECGEDGLPVDAKDCGVAGMACFEGRCQACRPGGLTCCTGWEPVACQPGLDVLLCGDDGVGRSVERTCDVACRTTASTKSGRTNPSAWSSTDSITS